jgi:hypothetical protein
MDGRRFDALTRALSRAESRRSLMKGLLGLGGIVAVGGVALEDDVRAARRATPTPKPASCPGSQTWDGSACVCPSGTACGPDCCTGGSECCDNACCSGICYGEELCCPAGQLVCNGLCLPTGACCTDADCIGARCLNNICVPYTPTNTPTDTPTNTAVPPTNTPTDTPTNAPVPATNTPTDTPTNMAVPPSNTPTDTPTGAATCLSDLAECRFTTGECCSGTCVEFSLFNDCSATTEEDFCGISNGAACEQHDCCASGACSQGVCVACLQTFEQCTSPGQCCASGCLGGFCI